jgi:hypothetical protein
MLLFEQMILWTDGKYCYFLVYGHRISLQVEGAPVVYAIGRSSRDFKNGGEMRRIIFRRAMTPYVAVNLA